MLLFKEIHNLILYFKDKGAQGAKPTGRTQRRGRQGRRTERPDCDDGQPCGFACIERKDDCLSRGNRNKTPWAVATERMTNFIKNFREKVKADPIGATGKEVRQIKARVVQEANDIYNQVLQKGGTEAQAAEAREDHLIMYQTALSTGQHPALIQEFRNNGWITDTNTGKQISFSEYAKILRDAKKDLGDRYQRGSVDEFGRSTPPTIDGKPTDAFYRPPEHKIRKVSDQEVDEVWDKLDKNVKDKMFSSSVGSPNRAYEDCRKRFKNNKKQRDQCVKRTTQDWGEGSENDLRLRKTMLKALLEQSFVDENGELKIIDPNEPRAGGVSFEFLDLDHVVPLNAGGLHGPAVDGSDSGEKYPSGNFVWTNKYWNRWGKGARDYEEADKFLAGQERLLQYSMVADPSRSKIEDNIIKGIAQMESIHAMEGLIEGVRSQGDYNISREQLQPFKRDNLNAMVNFLVEQDLLSETSASALKNKNNMGVNQMRDILAQFFANQHAGKEGALGILVDTIEDTILKTRGRKPKS